jgi:hypothetical protein
MDTVAIIIIGSALVFIMSGLLFNYYRARNDIKRPRPILVHEGNIMSLEQYKTIKKNPMKKKRTSPLAKTVNASQDITK